jgi:hypothetical protein
VVLIDFGIARFYRPGQAGDTAIYGTTGYAPPEQYGRGQTDARTDIYALGVLLHQLLTGHDPTSTPFALPPPAALNPAIPPQVAAAITRATATDRDARFADIEAFQAALRAPGPMTAEPAVVLRGAQQATAAMPGAPAATAPRRARSIWAWVIAGVIGVLLIGGLALALWPASRTGREQPTAEPALVMAPAEPAVSERATARPAAPTGLPGSARATSAPGKAPGEPINVTPAVDLGNDSVTPQATAPGSSVVLLRSSQVTASSVADPGVDAQKNPVTYLPQNAVDGRPDTAWRVVGDGAGQWLQLDFASDASVTSIGIIPGYDKIDPTDGTDRFFQSRIVKLARFEFSDGTVVRASFSRDRAMQIVPIGGVRARSIRIVIEETYPPPPASQGGRDFTPISEVLVQGTP